MNARSLCLLACVVLAGCPGSRPKPAPPGTPPQPGPATGPGDATAAVGEMSPIVRKPVKLVEVASVVVEPGSGDRTIPCNDRLAVTIPAGLVDRPVKLTVSVPAEPQPEPAPRLSPIGDFDVQLGDSREFSRDLTLAFPFDPGRLEPAIPAGMQVVAAFRDEVRDQWRRVPCSVDTAARTVRIRTRHLSRWAVWYENVRGFQCRDAYAVRGTDGLRWVLDRMGEGLTGDDIWFRVYFNPEADNPYSLHGSLGKGPPVIPSTFIRDILVSAYMKYAAASFEMPTGVFDVFLDPSIKGAALMDSTWYGIDNIIFVPGPASWESPAEVRQNVAHEFFHTVQNQSLNAPVSMTLRKWWVEATADYAAGRIAFPDDPDVWAYTVRFVKPWYPEKSLDYASEVQVGETGSADESDMEATKIDAFNKHHYHSCVFVDYLVRHLEPDRKLQAKAFHDLWAGVAKGWILPGQARAVLPALDAWLASKSGRNLASFFEWFAIHWYMATDGCASPKTKRGRVPESWVKSSIVVADDAETSSVSIGVNARYSAALRSLVFPAGGGDGRLMAFSCGTLPEGCSLYVFATDSDNRTPGTGNLPDPSDSVAMLKPGVPAYFQVRDAIVYVLAVNTGSEAQLLNVEVAETRCRIEPEEARVKAGESVTFSAVTNHAIPNAEYAWFVNDDLQEATGREFTRWFKEAGLFEERISVVVSDSVTGCRVIGASATVKVSNR